MVHINSTPGLMIVLCNLGSELQASIKCLIKSVVTTRYFTSKLAHFLDLMLQNHSVPGFRKTQEILKCIFGPLIYLPGSYVTTPVRLSMVFGPWSVFKDLREQPLAFSNILLK